MYVCMYIYIHIHIYIYICIYVYIRMYIYIYVCMYVCMYVCKCIYIHLLRADLCEHLVWSNQQHLDNRVNAGISSHKSVLWTVCKVLL